MRIDDYEGPGVPGEVHISPEQEVQDYCDQIEHVFNLFKRLKQSPESAELRWLAEEARQALMQKRALGAHRYYFLVTAALEIRAETSINWGDIKPRLKTFVAAEVRDITLIQVDFYRPARSPNQEEKWATFYGHQLKVNPILTDGDIPSDIYF